MNTDKSVDESNFLGARDPGFTLSAIAPRQKTAKAEAREQEKETLLAALRPGVEAISQILSNEKSKATDIRTYTDDVINDASSDGISVIVEIRARKMYVEMIDKLDNLLKQAGGNEQQF